MKRAVGAVVDIDPLAGFELRLEHVELNPYFDDPVDGQALRNVEISTDIVGKLGFERANEPAKR